MLSVILIWSYILITAYITGRAVITAARKFGIISAGYDPDDQIPYILTGLVAVTVYAQIWSLFGGVGAAANIVLCVAAVCCAVADRSVRRKTGPEISSPVSGLSVGVLLTCIVIFLIMAYGTSHGLMHYDTGLYHAQAIHWIESFGLVPGLANLHTRLGYNSSAFALNALYSFSFFGRSFHVTAGFCALLLAWECIVIPAVRIGRTGGDIFDLPDMARLAGLYYLLMIYDEMVSPASDYYMVCLAFIFVIRWLEHGRRDPSPGRDDTMPQSPDAYVLLCMLAGFILTVKLSGALLLLPVIWVVHLIVKQGMRDGRGWILKTAKCLLTGVIIVSPYLVRNLIISGWLLYPSSAFTFIHPDWQLPADIAQYDYREIQVYGRGSTDVGMYGRPVSAWWPDWFRMQSGTDRILIAAAMVGAVLFVVQCMVMVIRRRAPRNMLPATVTVTLTVVACFVFWMLTSPLMRYGCLYVYLTVALTWGGVLCELVHPVGTAGGDDTGHDGGDLRYRRRMLVMISLLCVLGGYKAVMWAGETIREYRSDTWILQQDYDSFETVTYSIGSDDADITLYAPVEGDRTGYLAFPSSPWDMSDSITLRGDDIRDGFRSAR